MKKQWFSILIFICSIPVSLGAEVIGVGNFSHIVADMDRAVIFYEEVLQLEPDTLPTEFSGNPAIMRLGNTPGGQSRIATFNIPGSELGVELIEYTDIDRQPIQTRFQDPGAALVQLRVKNLDGILARLENSQGQIWTPSGEPVSVGGNGRIIFLKDPDGFFVEVIEGEAPDTAAAGNVYGGNFELIINDTDQNAAFYRDGLGLDPQVSDGFDDTVLLTNTVNALGAGFRRTVLTLNDTQLNMAFLEFQGINRKPMNSRVQDPGTSILQIITDDVIAMSEQIVAAGGTLVPLDGPVDFGGGRYISLLRDPNNLFIELMGRE
jgi:predicted enzyme related to lactoylglutathione lyase